MKASTGLIALASLASTALATLAISQPSASIYFIQFKANTIAWSYSQGDPAQVSLQIVNSDSAILNGAFSIAEYVDTSIESFTITNVTLKTGDGYVVQMVNATNNTIVYASSSAFSVKPTNTPPAPGSGAPGNSTSTNGTSTANNSTSNQSGTNITTTNGTVTHVNGTANKPGTANGTASAQNVKSGAYQLRSQYVMAGLLSGVIAVAGLTVL